MLTGPLCFLKPLHNISIPQPSVTGVVLRRLRHNSTFMSPSDVAHLGDMVTWSIQPLEIHSFTSYPSLIDISILLGTLTASFILCFLSLSACHTSDATIWTNSFMISFPLYSLPLAKEYISLMKSSSNPSTSYVSSTSLIMDRYCILTSEYV